ncbi:MAG TPA: phosphoglycolate phosphatase [Bryobacteraceae bacterium]|nr:phosphoglycolate phosphatase [Bryobacteraceae bacterium]HPU73935.1 phosphoglycolate phosphatase [Bryobacteraceae bacterium]
MDLLIFDLDGTLIDSKLDLAHAVNATRRHFNLPPLDTELISTYVGNGAPVLMRRALPEASEEELAGALQYFLAYYKDHAVENTRPYAGIPEALSQLAAAGLLMAVLTNKPDAVSRHILEQLNLAPYFARIYGGNSFENKKPHPAGVHKLLEELGVAADRTMLVGDSAVDVRTARNAGIRVCGVTYGFQPDSFREHPPDMMVDRPEELVRAVIAERKARGITGSYDV